MTTHAFCDSCLLEKKLLCRWALAANIFANFAPCLDPKKGAEKWTQKWCQNLILKMGSKKWHPKMGSKNGTPKWGPKMAPKRGPNISIKKKSRLYLHFNTFFGCHFSTPFWGAIFGPHFGVPFLDPILVVKFWHHFWVHFSTPFLGSKTWCKICKNVCC